MTISSHNTQERTWLPWSIFNKVLHPSSRPDDSAKPSSEVEDESTATQDLGQTKTCPISSHKASLSSQPQTQEEPPRKRRRLSARATASPTNLILGRRGRSSKGPSGPHNGHPVESTPSNSPGEQGGDVDGKQINGKDTGPEKRKLRSQGDAGGRLKSELSVYFPRYTDIIHGSLDETGPIDSKTIITVRRADDSNCNEKHVDKNNDKTLMPSKPYPDTSEYISTSGNSSLEKPNNGHQNLDLMASEPTDQSDHLVDPLSDEHFTQAHKRAERREKHLRNIEKEKAMHEKAQLDKILQGLQSSDWPKVMGLNVTADADLPRWEDKRAFFIKEVRALVRKFDDWRDQEKKLRQDKEIAAMIEQDGSSIEQRLANTRPPRVATQSTSLRPTASGKNVDVSRGQDRGVALEESLPHEPFVSFFSKPHIRSAVLSRARSSRTTLAFGHPLPEMDSREFSLPAEYRSAASLKESARRRRRMNRESLKESGLRR